MCLDRPIGIWFWCGLIFLLSPGCALRLHAPLTFLPSGTGVVASGDDGLNAFDLGTGKARWQAKRTGSPILTLGLSPRGAFVVAQSNGNDAQDLLVVETAGGTVVGRFTDPSGEEPPTGDAASAAYLPESEPVSDDGKWLVQASRKGLRIFETSSAKAIFEDPLIAQGEFLIRPAFEPGSFRFAGLLAGRNIGLAVYARQGQGWSRVATLPKVLNYRWTPKGLLVITKQGLYLWKDTLGAPLFSLSFIESDNQAAVFFAEDGNFVAVETPERRLLIRAIPGGDTVLDVTNVGGVRDVQFHGVLARVLTYESRGNDRIAIATEYDLRSGKKRKSIELDVVSRLTPKGFFSFGFGGGWTGYRSYKLGPRGLFAACLHEGNYEFTKLTWDPL